MLLAFVTVTILYVLVWIGHLADICNELGLLSSGPQYNETQNQFIFSKLAKL